MLASEEGLEWILGWERMGEVKKRDRRDGPPTLTPIDIAGKINKPG